MGRILPVPLLIYSVCRKKYVDTVLGEGYFYRQSVCVLKRTEFLLRLKPTRKSTREDFNGFENRPE